MPGDVIVCVDGKHYGAFSGVARCCSTLGPDAGETVTLGIEHADGTEVDGGGHAARRRDDRCREGRDRVQRP